VREADLHAVWQEARKAGLATPNIGLLADHLLPGRGLLRSGQRKSIPIANAIQQRFDNSITSSTLVTSNSTFRAA
jgi:sulfite reductase (NADPH) hemoprotein beta-component